MSVQHLGTLRALNATMFRTSALFHALLASVAANDCDGPGEAA